MLVPVRRRPAIAFAASRTLPPPTPTTTSTSPSRPASTAASTTDGDGSSRTVAAPTTSSPPAAKPSSSVASRPDAARDRPPVTSSTRRPCAAASSGTRATVPSPNVIRGSRPSANAGIGGRPRGSVPVTGSPGWRLREQAGVPDAVAGLDEVVGRRLAPLEVVGLLAVGHRGRLVAEPLVEDDPGGVLDGLDDVEPEVAGLADRALVVRAGGREERVEELGLDVAVDERDEHRPAPRP